MNNADNAVFAHFHFARALGLLACDAQGKKT